MSKRKFHPSSTFSIGFGLLKKKYVWLSFCPIKERINVHVTVTVIITSIRYTRKDMFIYSTGHCYIDEYKMHLYLHSCWCLNENRYMLFTLLLLVLPSFCVFHTSNISSCKGIYIMSKPLRLNKQSRIVWTSHKLFFVLLGGYYNKD